MAIKQRVAKLEQRRGQGEKIDYAAILERARERVENGEVPKPLTREELTEQISQLEAELAARNKLPNGDEYGKTLVGANLRVARFRLEELNDEDQATCSTS